MILVVYLHQFNALIYMDMENNHSVRIEVYMNNLANKPCFVRELWLHPDIAIPFNRITEVMRFLFGRQCLVRFSSSVVEEMSINEAFSNNNNV